MGHNYDPVLFVQTGVEWACAGKLEGVQAKKAGPGKGSVMANRAMFQAQANTGLAESASEKAKLESVHQNLVCDLCLFGGPFGGTSAEFTSSALDGKVRLCSPALCWSASARRCATRDRLAGAARSL